MVTGKLSIIEWVFYVGCQVAGSIAGASLLAISFDDISSSCNAVPAGMTRLESFLLEAMLTGILMFTVMAAVDPSNKVKGNASLAIGASVILAHLVAITSTGTSINPARSFGPAFVVDRDACWDDLFYIFWGGPLAGAVAMALFYQYVLDVGRDSSDAREVYDDDRDTRLEHRSSTHYHPPA